MKLVELDQLEHAYAVTVHKAQGSEFDTVILALCFSATPFFTRNLLYTAITRAKNKVEAYGSASCMRSMVANKDNSKRATALRLELVELKKLFE